MGSFSFTCHLSGLPITSGIECVIIPLIPKAKWGYDISQEALSKCGKASLVSNDGPNAFFNELSFPIFGTYDDYGGMEEIIEDDNTRSLEEFFGIPIDNIVECLTGRTKEIDDEDDSKSKRHELLVLASSTWFRKDVYDKLAELPLSGENADSIDIGVHGVLIALGFELQEKPPEESDIIPGESVNDMMKRILSDVKERDRYNQEYKKGNVTLYSDGNWVNTSPKGGGPGIYSVKNLKDYCKNLGEEIDITQFKGSTYHSNVYDYILPYVNTITSRLSGDRWTSDRVIHLLLGDEHKIKMSSYSLIEDEHGEDMLETMEATEEFKEVLKKIKKEGVENQKKYGTSDDQLAVFYFKKIKEIGNGFLRKNIIDWFKVKSYYYPTGRFLYPIGTSPQCGDRKSVLTLLNVAVECLEEEIANRDSDYEDEEDDLEIGLLNEDEDELEVDEESELNED